MRILQPLKLAKQASVVYSQSESIEKDIKSPMKLKANLNVDCLDLDDEQSRDKEPSAPQNPFLSQRDFIQGLLGVPLGAEESKRQQRSSVKIEFSKRKSAQDSANILHMLHDKMDHQMEGFALTFQ